MWVIDFWYYAVGNRLLVLYRGLGITRLAHVLWVIDYWYYAVD